MTISLGGGRREKKNNARLFVARWARIQTIAPPDYYHGVSARVYRVLIWCFFFFFSFTPSEEVRGHARLRNTSLERCLGFDRCVYVCEKHNVFSHCSLLDITLKVMHTFSSIFTRYSYVFNQWLRQREQVVSVRGRQWVRLKWSFPATGILNNVR